MECTNPFDIQPIKLKPPTPWQRIKLENKRLKEKIWFLVNNPDCATTEEIIEDYKGKKIELI